MLRLEYHLTTGAAPTATRAVGIAYQVTQVEVRDRSSRVYLPPCVTSAFLASVHRKAVWCIGCATGDGID